MNTDKPIALDPSSAEAIIEQIVAKAAERICAAQERPGGLTVAKAWIYQRPRDVAKHGEEDAPHYVGWYDPGGKLRGKCCGPGADGLKKAHAFRRKTEAQLLTGTYDQGSKKTWQEFREEYRDKVLAGKAAKTREQAEGSLDNFERIVKPGKVSGITTKTIDGFIAHRRLEKRRLRPDRAPKRPRVKPLAEAKTISPATVNADLRNLKAALAVAHDWGYLATVPKVRMLREPKRLPRYVLPEHFAALYQACETAGLPAVEGYSPSDWWRGVLVLIYVATGWRIGQILGVRRSDLDLTAGTIRAQAEITGNKAREERLVKLHPVALDHLHRLPALDDLVFPWPHDRRTLYTELQRLCSAGKVPRYGFHALRKGFGSMNAPRLDPAALQHLMQHASLATTMKYYVNPLAEQEKAVGQLSVPEVLRDKAG